MSSIFDILGPVMVGPSSSHTAGAVRIGYTARQLFGEPVKKAIVYLHGSFAATGEGHGTDKAIIAGLLGMKPDDLRIPDSFTVAKESGMEFEGRDLSRWMCILWTLWHRCWPSCHKDNFSKCGVYGSSPLIISIAYYYVFLCKNSDNN